MNTKRRPVLTGFKALLRKGFGVETFTYYSHLSIAELKTEIQKVIDASDGFSFFPKLSGTFLSANEFEMTLTRNIVYLQTRPDLQERQLAYIYVRLFKDEQDRTAVWLAVRPNAPIPPALALLFPLIWFAGILLLSHTVWQAPLLSYITFRLQVFRCFFCIWP